MRGTNGRPFKDYAHIPEFGLNAKMAALTDKATLSVLKYDRASGSYSTGQATLVLPLKLGTSNQEALGFSYGSAIIVEEVREGTPAAQAGIKPGDFLQEINGQIIPNLENTMQLDVLVDKAVKSGEKINFKLVS